MEKAKVYLFTSLTCPHCPTARSFITKFKKERNDFELINAEVQTKEGNDLAKQFDIDSVPTFIIQGPAYPENIGLRNYSEKTMNKYLDIALGKTKLIEPRKLRFSFKPPFFTKR